jgi:hypothetical protein
LVAVLYWPWLLFFVDHQIKGFTLLDHTQIGAGFFFDGIEIIFQAFHIRSNLLIALAQGLIVIFLLLQLSIELSTVGETALTDPQSPL